MFRFEFLEKHIKQHALKVGAELGLWKGRTFLHLLSTCPDLTMYGVDEWKLRPDRRKIPGGDTYDNYNMQGLHRYVVEHSERFNGRAKILHMSTVDAAKEIPDASLDFVFIDADHTEDGVRQDIEHWRPKIRRGGFLMGHDFVGYPTVKKVVEEIVPNYQVSADDVEAVWFAQV